MQKQDTTVTHTTLATQDFGKVRLGGMSPSLPVRAVPASVSDTRKVRLGGMSPVL